nr:MAG TPA: hypothetical protein [Caudoviricetes sp.]
MLSWFSRLTNNKILTKLTSWRFVTASNVSYRWLVQAFRSP